MSSFGLCATKAADNSTAHRYLNAVFRDSAKNLIRQYGLVDTGNTVPGGAAISANFAAQLGAKLQPSPLKVSTAAVEGSLEVAGMVPELTMAVSPTMLLTLKEVMVYKNLSHPLNFGLDFLVQQQANLDYSGDQPQIIIRDTSYPLVSTIDPHETKFLKYTGPASAAADNLTDRSTASARRNEGSAAAASRNERSTAAEKQQTANNQMSTFCTFKELTFNNPTVPLMVAALAPSSFEGTSAVNIGKEPNLTNKDSLKFKSTEVKLEGISKSEKCVQDGPYFIEVNKKTFLRLA